MKNGELDIMMVMRLFGPTRKNSNFSLMLTSCYEIEIQHELFVTTLGGPMSRPISTISIGIL
ncbi:hypothetical protein A4G99_19150 [Haladaptatus sp. R4]|nr:hypothetical protein A4G99_19150 [Haladaptatus sp. R4]